MQNGYRLASARSLGTYRETMDAIANHVRQKASPTGALDILEAGCGTKWGVDLQGVQYTLTGIDVDKNALEMRKNLRKDLDIAVLADLRVASLEANSYDVIFSYNVLEHLAGAEDVLRSFVRWLRPGGIMILVFPNRDCAYSFLTRITPFPLHVFYKKYVQGEENAGKPGHDPYPTVFDRVVSRHGIYQFCRRHDLIMRAEYRLDRPAVNNQAVWFLVNVAMWTLHLISFKKLSVDHRGLLYVIEKP